MEENLEKVNICLFDDYYMVCNEGVYFKLGLKEGRILQKLQSGILKDVIVNEEDVTLNELNYMLKIFEENGIIGEKKEKHSLLFMKFPLFEVDNKLQSFYDWLKRHKNIRKACCINILFLILIGAFILINNYQDIFKINNLKLPIYQYFIVYVIYFGIIFCHELGHGFACKSFGGKVGKVGIAFIIFNPAMYCDISSVRMFKKKYMQVICSMAGFIANAAFIGFFSIIYLFHRTNIIRIMIVLNTTTILINALPFVRLDGYWILSFSTGVQNLYKKSLIKIKKIGIEKEFQNWKDYFVLGYGIMNCFIILYCCTEIVIKSTNFILKTFIM